MSGAPPTHAIVIVFHKTPAGTYEVFVGQETTYFKDARGTSMFPRNPTDTDAQIKAHPTLAGHPNRTFVRREHIRADGSISYKFTVQEVTGASTWGFPKGRQEAVDTSPQDNAKREFWEEVSYNLETANLGAPTVVTTTIQGSPVSSNLFMVEVDATEKGKIVEAYENKMCTRKGELHNALFVDYTTFASATGAYKRKNALSTAALLAFATANGLATVVPGGGLRRRNSKGKTRRSLRK
jgi:8-oxo-dGTP pyrophosphatase MutT (NUDIX family)